mmetsp:Transcript_17965/g.56128  ORF Transcript_17965/g.56128 Transcript_17965/m.56128 type:complete len:200 (+) Transcript_17965:1260-1859(+)
MRGSPARGGAPRRCCVYTAPGAAGGLAEAHGRRPAAASREHARGSGRVTCKGCEQPPDRNRGGCCGDVPHRQRGNGCWQPAGHAGAHGRGQVLLLVVPRRKAPRAAQAVRQVQVRALLLAGLPARGLAHAQKGVQAQGQGTREWARHDGQRGAAARPQRQLRRGRLLARGERALLAARDRGRAVGGAAARRPLRLRRVH